jgi:hypothetical protein
MRVFGEYYKCTDGANPDSGFASPQVSNLIHEPFLCTENQRAKKKSLNIRDFLLLAVRTGLEPATPCVTGTYSNQLNYRTSISYWECKSNTFSLVAKKISIFFKISFVKAPAKGH